MFFFYAFMMLHYTKISSYRHTVRNLVANRLLFSFPKMLSFLSPCWAARAVRKKNPRKKSAHFPSSLASVGATSLGKTTKLEKKLGFSKGVGRHHVWHRTRRGICGQVGHLRNVCSMFPIGQGTALCC